MRIAIDLRSLMETGGKISGVENYLLNILRGLPDRSSYFGFYNSFRKVFLPSFGQLQKKRTSIPNKILNFTLTFFNLPKLESLYDPFDLLWMPDIRPFAIRKGTKLAVSVHDLSALTYPRFYSLKRRIWHRVIRYKKALTRADIIFADSEYTKYDIQKLFAVDPEKIKVVHLGVDTNRFNLNLDKRLLSKVKNRYALPDQFILSVSTIEPRKNIPALIEAFENIADPSMHLVIAGRLGWLYNDVLERVDRSPKKAKIKVVGYISEEDKPYLISLANMVCYPSFYEGFGLVPLEAMACGVPVITSARTSIPEVCEDAALLVEPYSLVDLITAINSLIADENLRSTLIKKGLVQAQKFSWHKTIKETDYYLQQLV